MTIRWNPVQKGQNLQKSYCSRGVWRLLWQLRW